MKKIFLGLAMAAGSLAFAQYQDNGWGNGGYGNNGYYGNSYGYGDDYYFPDDYYYDYPTDYYADNYYQSYYNDYRNSIIMVNWNDFFRSARLSRWQIQQVVMLNEMFSSYSSWDSYYRHNPDRWYYDRFYSLRQILGPKVFIVFQNNYYRGYDPVVYFQNYRRDYYTPRFRVKPRYTNVNVNIYKVDRNRFYETHGNKYGWNETRNPHNPGGFKENNSGTYRNDGGFRNSTSERTSESVRKSSDNGGFRNQSSSTRPNTNNGGFRNSSSGENRVLQNNGTRNTLPSAGQVRESRNDGNKGMRNTSEQTSGQRSGGNERTANSANVRGGGLR